MSGKEESDIRQSIVFSGTKCLRDLEVGKEITAGTLDTLKVLAATAGVDWKTMLVPLAHLNVSGGGDDAAVIAAGIESTQATHTKSANNLDSTTIEVHERSETSGDGTVSEQSIVYQSGTV